jgi:hypothetical protein
MTSSGHAKEESHNFQYFGNKLFGQIVGIQEDTKQVVNITCCISTNLRSLQHTAIVAACCESWTCNWDWRNKRFSLACGYLEGTERNGKIKVEVSPALRHEDMWRCSSILTSTLDGSEWSASHLNRTSHRERTQGLGGPRAGLDAIEGKTFCLCMVSNAGRRPSSS